MKNIYLKDIENAVTLLKESFDSSIDVVSQLSKIEMIEAFDNVGTTVSAIFEKPIT